MDDHMDISKTIEAKSDQLNAVDFTAGPEVVTITEVKKGDADQPVWISTAEHPGKYFKPSKTVRRILVAAWGKDAAQYAGQRLELYNDPSVTWAGEAVGGIRVSAMSHIAKPMTIPVTVARGKRQKVVIEPLPDVPGMVQRDWAAEIEAADTDTLRNLWHEAPPEYQPAIQSRAELLKPTPAQEEE